MPHPSSDPQPELRRLRILLVSQMYPGPQAPYLGSFVAELERELAAKGHELARAVVDRRGGRSRHAALALDVTRTARSFRPDVVYAHVFAASESVDPRTAKLPRVNPIKGNAPFEAVNGGTYAASADLFGLGAAYTFR